MWLRPVVLTPIGETGKFFKQYEDLQPDCALGGWAFLALLQPTADKGTC